VPFVGVCLNISTEQYWYRIASKTGNCKKGKCDTWTEEEYGYYPVNMSGLPQNEVKHVASAAVGSFIVPWEGYLEEIDCNVAPVSPTKTPEDFHAISSGSPIYSDSKDPPDSNEKRTRGSNGDKRVRFQGNDMTETTVTVLGKNNGGIIEPWESPPSKFCSSPDSTLFGLKTGNADKEQFFTSLAEENHDEAMAMRLGGLLCIFLGLGCLSGCTKETPCCRALILPIVPASACAGLSFGVIRVLIQPDLIGISAIGVSFCILVLTILVIRRARRSRKDESAGEQTAQV